jgi:hypothetical protein
MQVLLIFLVVYGSSFCSPIVTVVPKAKRPCAVQSTLQNAAIDHFNLLFVCRRYREAGVAAATENIALGGANVFVRNTAICRKFTAPST